MLLNGSFEEGYEPLVDVRWPVGHDYRGPIPNMNVPAGWTFWYALNGSDPNAPFYHSMGEPKLVPQDQPWGRPEVVTWRNPWRSGNFGPDFEHAYAWRDGEFTLKVFGAFVPIWFRLSQTVTGLTVGSSYTLIMPVYLELISSYGPTVPAQDPNSGSVNLYSGSSESGTETGYIDPSFMQWNTLRHSFIATESEMRIGVEVQCRWGLVANNVYIDGATLVEAAQPIIAPVEAPVVDRNNTYQISMLLDKAVANLERIRKLI